MYSPFYRIFPKCCFTNIWKLFIVFNGKILMSRFMRERDTAKVGKNSSVGVSINVKGTA